MADRSSTLRIIHIDTGRELRGGQEQLLLLARGLGRRGHEQLIVCRDGSQLEFEARKEGLRVFTLPAHDPGHGHGILQLRQQLLAEPFEVLHAHDGRGQTISWLASLGMPVRRVASRLVAFPPRSPFLHRLKYGLGCHGIIAVSESVRQLLISLDVPEAKIEVILPGVELPLELPDADTRSRVRAQWGFGERELVVGHVGAFTAEKGQDIALDAAVLLRKALPQARFLLAGDGPTRASSMMAEKLRQTCGLALLPGYVLDLTAFFAGLDLYIMPSRAEGLGLSAVLAMAHGLAVVASRIGGLPEVVQEGKTGWLVSPGSPSALAEAIASAASDPMRLRQFGTNARERARQFSSDVAVARTEAFYRRLLAS